MIIGILLIIFIPYLLSRIIDYRLECDSFSFWEDWISGVLSIIAGIFFVVALVLKKFQKPKTD